MKKWIHSSQEPIAPWKDPELEYVCNTDGFQCYRKIVNGRGKWFAHNQDEPIETMFPITYDQARGFEPMPNESSIRRLQRELGKLLLPPGY